MTRRSRAAKVSRNTSAPFPRATVSDCPAGTGASVKIPCSSNFLRKKEEDAADWLERYESTAKYNGRANEKAENFGMHLDGAAQKWFLCSGAPGDW